MLHMFRLILILSSLAAAVAATSSSALAQQGQDQAPQQIALTQQQIDGLIASQAEMGALQSSPQQSDRADQPDPKAQAKMEAVAKKHGFTGLDQYGAVTESIGIVMAGIDPDTKRYVGPAAVIKKQIAQVQADRTMPPKDKAQALKELKEAMAAGDSAKPPAGNIDLVSKNFGKLSQAFQSAGGD